jgi:hypothetical protein
MRHPGTRAARRRVRRAVIARRTAAAVSQWSVTPGWMLDPATRGLTGRWSKWNPLVCCTRCQWDPPRPGWRWDGLLDDDGILPRPPVMIEGMGAR